MTFFSYANGFKLRYKTRLPYPFVSVTKCKSMNFKIVFLVFLESVLARLRVNSFAEYRRMLNKMSVPINVVKYPGSSQSTAGDENYVQKGNNFVRNYRLNAYRRRMYNGYN